MIIAIDGPAASGKSTTARRVAERLGYLYLDTGAMYRAVALAFLRSGRDATEADAAALLPEVHLGVAHVGGEMRVLLGGEDVTEAVRAPEVGALASKIGMLPSVREKLVAEQRRLARTHVAQGRGVVLDGRDIGTIVFPDADLKIFMVADAKARAARRHAELQARGVPVSEAAVLEEILQRDEQDRRRALAPLRKAEDAVELDTTPCSIEEQVQLVIDKVKERLDGKTV